MKENQELQRGQQATDIEIQALEEHLQQHMNSSGLPFEFIVKYTKEKVYSLAFYTHPHGYRMCVRVDLNGKGTHVSIYICMMSGPFDDSLQWPFRGDVTIQIVNQAGDHHHIEKIIEVPEHENVRPESVWGFPRFLAHSRLAYNAVRMTQYLKDNHLIVRVVKVTLD